MTNHQNGRSSCPTIYFAKVPTDVELCSVSLQVCSDSPGISNIAQFGSQPQIIKCRELIFTEPNVLASPSLQEQGLIFVIIQKSFWKTGKLQMRCQKSGLKIGKPSRVISAVFQACLSYTLKAKLAPLWNKAGDLYVQGRDFLTSSAKANAMGVEVNVTDAEICLALKPTLVKLSQSDIRDFEISPGVLEHFFSSNDHTIPEYAIEDKWCHILPSLKKGKVVSITHHIPPVSPFRTYKDIRRYWKNAYGYRLPESDVGIIYYNVYFPAIGNTLFTIYSYPDFCVFKRGPVSLPRIDPMTIMPSFLADLETKIPSICGFPFKVNPKAQYATTGLYQASIQNNSLSGLTLSTLPPSYPPVNYPPRQVPPPCQANPYGSPHTPQRQALPPNRALAKAFDAAFKQAGAMNKNQALQQSQQANGYGSMQPLNTARHQQQQVASPRPHIPPSHIAQMYSSTQHASSPVGYQTGRPVLSQSYLGSPVPVHTPVGPQSGRPFMSQSHGDSPVAVHTPIHYQSGRPTQPHIGSPIAVHTPVCYQSSGAIMTQSHIGSPVAVHTPVRYQSQAPSQPCTSAYPSPGMPNNSPHPSLIYNTMSSPATHHQPSQPYQQDQFSRPQFTMPPHGSFQVPTSPAPQMLTPVPQQSPLPPCAKIVPSFRPHKARNLTTVPQSLQATKVIPVFKPTSKRSITPSFSAKLQLDFDKELHEDQPTSHAPLQPALKPTFGTSNLVPIRPKFGGNTPSTAKVGDKKTSSVNKPSKRKAKSTDPEQVAKKPRSKPKVQEGIDMQTLLVNDQLTKVNTATLITWLKDKNIKVKSREKKADLVVKVMDYINAKTKEN